MSDDPAGRTALETIDAVLADRPKKDDAALAEVTKALCAYRETVIAAGGDPATDAAQRDRLERLNGVLTVVLGMHFPTAEPLWDELGKARGWLADLLAEPAGA